MQAGKLLHRPHIPMLEERNTRKGFFELEMLQDVLAHLPEPLRPVIEFAYITGWRIPSEVLTLEWRQVDFNAGEVRLDPETTKNREARVFPMTDDLRALLVARYAEHQALKLKGQSSLRSSSGWLRRGATVPSNRVRFARSTRHGLPHAPRPAVLAASRMTCDARRCAT
jgi:integrase